MTWRQHIAVDPAVCHGQACVKGTRIPVAVVLANLAEGMSQEELLKQYPALTAEGILAAIAFAAELTQERNLDVPA